jgi:FAD/FMN-containing dehydrogenase
MTPQNHSNVLGLSAFSFDKALSEWTILLGSEHVLTDERAQAYNNCPSQSTRHIPAVLLPTSQEDVRKIMLIAARYRVPLHPVSTGKNWGFGGAAPGTNSAVIVDMHLMNRIVDFIPDLGIVTVEPGVTQRQLSEFLRQGNYPFIVSVSSASPDCSIIGNALERGHGMMPYMDRFASLTSLKAVLPDGSLYQSLLADGGGEEIDRAYKWGVGPYLDGLFSQGGFGLVTQASFILAPKPELTTMFFFRPRPDVTLDELMAKLRRVKHDVGHLISTFELGTRTNAQDHMLSTHDISLEGWSVMGGIHASREMTKFVIASMRKDLRSVATDFVFLNEDTIEGYAQKKFWQRDTSLRAYVRENMEMMRGMLGFLEGTPQEKAMMYAYHRRPQALKGDESLKSMERNLRDIGLIWYWPILPARGSDVRMFLQMMERISKRHGFNPVWNFNLEHSTYVSAGVHIFYDPATEQERAMAYYKDLFEEGKAMGYLPHRPHIDSSTLYAPAEQSRFYALLAKLKDAVDPANLISMRVQLPRDKTTQ